ncbi:MAG: phage holin family protein, partial [Candidatus Nealsonbacteria bacterium]
MKRLIGNIIVGVLALYLASLLVPGVEIQGTFENQIKTILFAGIFLGLVNFFIKPIINLITFPLRLITFGLFGLVVNMVMIWLVDIFFPQVNIEGLGALFWTAIIVWFL